MDEEKFKVGFSMTHFGVGVTAKIGLLMHNPRAILKFSNEETYSQSA